MLRLSRLNFFYASDGTFSNKQLRPVSVD